MVQKPNFR